MIVARSIVLRSSRTFPGHVYVRNRSSSEASMPEMAQP